MLSVVSLTMVGKWFGPRLPLAMGVYSVLMGIGFGIAFTSVGELVQAAGWRGAWRDVGLALLAFAPLAWLLVRDRSREEMERSAGVGQIERAASGATLGQALLAPAFWTFVAGSSAFGAISSGLALFNQQILAERGFDAKVYYWALGFSALVGMGANLAGGWLARRISLCRMMAWAMLGMACALVYLSRLRTLSDVYAYTALMGASGGLVTVLFFTVWGQAFGRAHLGRIQGAAQMLTVVASAVGPEVVAWGESRTSSFLATFDPLAALAATIGLLAWFTPWPQPRGQVAENRPLAPSPADESAKPVVS